MYATSIVDIRVYIIIQYVLFVSVNMCIFRFMLRQNIIVTSL